MSDAYLTAKELGITEEERSGLITLVPILHRSSDLTLADSYSRRWECFPDRPGVGFALEKMASVRTPTLHKGDPAECGTVACIGGHLSLLMQGLDLSEPGSAVPTPLQMDRVVSYVVQFQIALKHHPLKDLFYPPVLEIRYSDWYRVHSTTAAAAVVNFLTTGRPSWRSAARQCGQPGLVQPENERLR